MKNISTPRFCIANIRADGEKAESARHLNRARQRNRERSRTEKGAEQRKERNRERSGNRERSRTGKGAEHRKERNRERQRRLHMDKEEQRNH